MYTRKMHKALRRDMKGKQNQVTDLLDEIDRLNNLLIELIIDNSEPTESDIKWVKSVLEEEYLCKCGYYAKYPVCTKCGTPTVYREPKTLSWHDMRMLGVDELHPYGDIG